MSHKKILFITATLLSFTAAAATETKDEQSKITWFTATGLGYDSNVYQTPSAPYLDSAPAIPVVVTPVTQSGFFVPLEMKMTAEKNQNANSRLIGLVSLKGDFYTAANARNANVYDLDLSGGREHVLEQKGVVEDTIFYGVFVGKHEQTYADHDTGLEKISGISDRYRYTSVGIEAEYKHRIGSVDYGVKGKYAQNNFADPVVVSQLDNTHLKVGADFEFEVSSASKLKLAYSHAVLDYSDRHSRDSSGVLSNANPLLVYTTNSVGASLRNRLSANWVMYLDYDRTHRTDDYVAYNDYTQNKTGVRILYGKDAVKARLALERWTRDYPNAYAFDVATQSEKTYDGSNLKFKAEWAQSADFSFWAEMIFNIQNSTDLRYDYERKQIMAGMSWVY